MINTRQSATIVVVVTLLPAAVVIDDEVGKYVSPLPTHLDHRRKVGVC